MKKLFFISIIYLVWGLAPHVFAADSFTALAPIPGLTDSGSTSVVNSETLANFFNNLYKYLIGLAGILAVIEIIWGGLEISTQDSVSKNEDGKGRIYGAIMGLILVLSPVLVFTIINPSILNLSLNLPKLDTTFKPATINTKPKSGCADPTLTLEQRKDCATAQSISGTNPNAPATAADIKYYFEGGGKEANEKTLADQVKTCTDSGGFVSGDALYRDRSSGRCSTSAEKYMRKNGYTSCLVLVNTTSVCFSK